jgi:hypothetical protein
VRDLPDLDQLHEDGLLYDSEEAQESTQAIDDAEELNFLEDENERAEEAED